MRKSRQVSRAAPALGLFKETPYLSLLLSSGIAIGLVCCTTSLCQFHQEQGTYAAVGLKQFFHFRCEYQGWPKRHFRRTARGWPGRTAHRRSLRPPLKGGPLSNSQSPLFARMVKNEICGSPANISQGRKRFWHGASAPSTQTF
jgi:hypothetical protein